MTKIILASESPARLELLKILNIFPDKVIPSEIDETPIKKERPHKLAFRLSFEKCKKVSANFEEAVVIAADSVVACGTRILPKASSDEEVRFCLELLSGRSHKVYTGLTVIYKTSEKTVLRTKLVTTSLKFRIISKKEIEEYLEKGEGINKAGGYSIQGSIQRFIKSINGQVSNVVGLPLYELDLVMKSFGIKI